MRNLQFESILEKIKRINEIWEDLNDGQE